METAVVEEAHKAASWECEEGGDAASSDDSETSKKTRNGKNHNKRPTRIRGNESQITFMVEFMSKHPEMAQYEASKSSSCRQQHRAEWSALTRRINMLGPKKSTAQWKKAWRAQRHRATRVGEQHGHNPAALALHASTTCRQILDILRDGSAKAGKTIDTNVVAAMESAKCETKISVKFETPVAGGVDTTTSASHGECACTAAQGDQTPVVSWNWDPLGAPASPAASSDAPLRTSFCKCNTAGVEDVLQRIEEMQSKLLKAAQRQTDLLEKLVEQSTQQGSERLTAEARQNALQERALSLQERLVSLAEAGLYRQPPAPHHRYHNHAS